MLLDDNKIVELFCERSESAILETANKYGKYCKIIAINILHDNGDADECVNDTYLCAWNSIPPHYPTWLSVYLGRITRNLSFNMYKKKKAGKRGGGELELIFDELEDCVSSPRTVEDDYTADMLSKAISTFLRTLNEEHQAIFVRRYWYSDSIGAISQKSKMSESKIKSILFRCRTKLKQYLKKEGFSI